MVTQAVAAFEGGAQAGAGGVEESRRETCRVRGVVGVVCMVDGVVGVEGMGVAGLIIGRWAFMGRGGDHELEALFGSRELGDVVFGVGAADVLLHGAEALLL